MIWSDMRDNTRQWGFFFLFSLLSFFSPLRRGLLFLFRTKDQKWKHQCANPLIWLRKTLHLNESIQRIPRLWGFRLKKRNISRTGGWFLSLSFLVGHRKDHIYRLFSFIFLFIFGVAIAHKSHLIGARPNLENTPWKMWHPFIQTESSNTPIPPLFHLNPTESERHT